MNYFLKKNKGAYFYFVDKILDFGKYPKVFFRAKYNLLEHTWIIDEL